MTDHDLMIKAFGSSPVGFSPLTSGDDSQRLQVQLRIDVMWRRYKDAVYAATGLDGEKHNRTINFDPAIEGDDLRAMREAIFLVAVEIGKTMK